MTGGSNNVTERCQYPRNSLSLKIAVKIRQKLNQHNNLYSILHILNTFSQNLLTVIQIFTIFCGYSTYVQNKK